MASTLSHSAIHRIMFLVENYDLHISQKEMTDASSLLPPPRRYVPELERMNFKWAVVYDLYRNIAPAPPLGYLDSLELTLVIKGAVDDADVRAIYSHGRPMEFWGCPRLFVSKIVEVKRRHFK